MQSQTQRTHRKFIGEILEEEAQLLDVASKLDKRSKISLIRTGAVEYAKKIIAKNSKLNSVQSSK